MKYQHVQRVSLHMYLKTIFLSKLRGENSASAFTTLHPSFPQPAEVRSSFPPVVSWDFWLINNFSHSPRDIHKEWSRCQGAMATARPSDAQPYLPGTQNHPCWLGRVFSLSRPSRSAKFNNHSAPVTTKAAEFWRGVRRSGPLMLAFCSAWTLAVC